ncbi:DsbA family protein [Quadrisphaera sp. GCM10027208]|uniref:DsbA family protein n=1 Tax=Quadrisphaera sp. GCM10027208 TaxID=3273423 RepID=UPI00360D9CCB
MSDSPAPPTSTSRETARSSGRGWLAPLVVLLAAGALVVAALVGTGGSAGDTAAPAASPSEDAGAGAAGDADAAPGDGTDEQSVDEAIAALAHRDEGDPYALGDVDAPVVMIEWSDFQCPFCGRFARETKPELVEQYVEDGVLRIEWRDFPYLGEESRTAALAGRAAAEQDAFWEFHDALFAEQASPNSGQLDADRLVGLAEELGLDVEAFAAAMDDPANAEAVDADFTEGQMLGITGTPTFLVGTQPVVGAQPLEVFQQAIEAAAAEAADAGE